MNLHEQMAVDLAAIMGSGDVGEQVDYHDEDLAFTSRVPALVSRVVMSEYSGSLLADTATAWLLANDLETLVSPVIPARGDRLTRNPEITPEAGDCREFWTVLEAFRSGPYWELVIRANARASATP